MLPQEGRHLLHFISFSQEDNHIHLGTHWLNQRCFQLASVPSGMALEEFVERKCLLHSHLNTALSVNLCYVTLCTQQTTFPLLQSWVARNTETAYTESS